MKPVKCNWVAAACLVAFGALQAGAEERSVGIPNNIVTHNVPALPQSLGDRLARYNHTRSAGLVGWAGDELLIMTRFAETNQLHKVGQPLGYREQLTYLPEPLAGVGVPRTGAKEEILISWDEGGSEFDQLFVFNLRTGESRMVSDGKSLYSGYFWSPDETHFVYVTTERNGRNWDTHMQSTDGEKTILLETDQGYWFPMSWSRDQKRLLIKNRVSINESSLFELEIESGELTPLLGQDERIAIGGAMYDNRGGVFFTSDQNSEFQRLHRVDLASGEVEVLTADVEWNVDGFSLSADFKRLAYVVNVGGISEVTVISLPGYKKVQMPELPQGVVGSLLFSPDGRRLGLTINSATSPADVYVAEVGGTDLTRWTQSEVGGLDRSRFVDAELIEYPTFDGRQIPAFVYTPEGGGPHPVVVFIHGGPEAQYRPYFSTLMQSYATEMNVAVIAPNVRGSNGYGKTYLELDNGKLREDSVRDIGALLDWIGGQDQFRSDRVAVMGGSYGGYMVLASMVHYGDRLAAAVESVGISNFVTFLENTQAYRQDMRRVEYGDERDPEMRAHLEAISPLNHVDKMVTPVLISQGANDPRVPASESEQIRLALEEAGVPVWYILAKDEGHGFRKKANRDYDRVAKFAFLEAYLNAE